MAAEPERRICRTPDEAWEAGYELGRTCPPLTQQQIDKLAPLWRIYLRPVGETAA